MLKALQATAEDIAQRAGTLIQEYAARPENSTRHKTSDVNLVTEADKATEALIVAAIQETYPDHHIHGEEGGGYGPPAENAPFRWYVDPVDGTTNFAHRLPLYSVSLAVVNADNEPVVGVIHNPAMAECFSAIKGGGATLNGQLIQVSQVDVLLRALLVTGFPYDRQTNPDNNMRESEAFLVRAQGFRRLGSAALDMAYVACGRVDGYWEPVVNSWDMMAGLLLVREAGGYVTNYVGGTDDFMKDGQSLVASNGLLHDAMLAVLVEARDGR